MIQYDYRNSRLSKSIISVFCYYEVMIQYQKLQWQYEYTKATRCLAFSSKNPGSAIRRKDQKGHEFIAGTVQKLKTLPHPVHYHEKAEACQHRAADV